MLEITTPGFASAESRDNMKRQKGMVKLQVVTTGLTIFYYTSFEVQDTWRPVVI